jgi:hypothetical protein
MLEPRWKDDGLVGNQVNKRSGLGHGELPAGLKGGDLDKEWESQKVGR